jgi:hypothetical protein
MRPLKPAQAGFLPASRDFSRPAASSPVFLRRTAGRGRQDDVGVDRNLSRSFRRYAQKRSAHPSSRPTRGSLAGLSIGERDAPPEARAGGLPACQPRLQSPGGLRSAALTHPAAPRAEARRACLSANGMRPLKPAQAGFLPASRDFSRPAASEPQFQAVRSEAQRSPIQPPHARKPGGLIYGERNAPPEARAGGLPACQPRLQSPG